MNYYLIFQENNEGIITYGLTTDYRTAYLTFKQEVIKVLKEQRSYNEYVEIDSIFKNYEVADYFYTSYNKTISNQCYLNLKEDEMLFNIDNNLAIFVKPLGNINCLKNELMIFSTYDNQNMIGDILFNIKDEKAIMTEIQHDMDDLLDEIKTLLHKNFNNINSECNNQISLTQTQTYEYKKIVLVANKTIFKYYIQPVKNINIISTDPLQN